MKFLTIALLITCSCLYAQENFSREPQQLRLSDVEDDEIGRGFDILAGGVVNTFNGSAQNYLGIGGGLKVDILLMSERKFGIGMDMSFYGNHIKKNYPIASTRKQNNTSPTLLIGMAFQWIVKKNKKRQISLQFEANYAQQNISKKIYIDDTEWDRFNGFSPAVLVHYMIKLGHDKLDSYYRGPVVVSRWLNFHLGIRPLFYNSSAANGAMLEMGISYRMKANFIKPY